MKHMEPGLQAPRLEGAPRILTPPPKKEKKNLKKNEMFILDNWQRRFFDNLDKSGWFSCTAGLAMSNALISGSKCKAKS